MLIDSIDEHNAQGAALARASEHPRAWLPFDSIPYVLSTIDALSILAVSLLTSLLYHSATGTVLPEFKAYVALGLMASVVFVVRISGQGYYEFDRATKPGIEIAEVLVCWISTAFLLTFFAFIFKVGVEFSRGAVALFVATAPLALLANRWVTKAVLVRLIARNLIGGVNSIMLADESELVALEKTGALKSLGLERGRCISLSPDPTNDVDRPINGAGIKAASDAVRRNPACEILVAVPWHDARRIEGIRKQLRQIPASVKMLPDSAMNSLCALASAGEMTRRSLVIELQRPPLSTIELAVKRSLDILISLTALVFFALLLLLTALAIKLDSPGPVVFRQTRKGFNGKRFTMLKFRTMLVQENGKDIKQATRNDPRVTRIGRLLRSSSIDELPQLINVLRGDMSLIGPRPHALAHDEHFTEVLGNYAFRQHVKPGMTGWAQVHGARGATPTVETIAKRVELDLWYIDNWSMWLDFRIMAMTVVEVFRKRNAY